MEKRGRSVSREKPRYSAGKQLAREVFLETMNTIDVRRAMLSRLRKEPTALVAGDIRFPLDRPPRIVAFGKAANRMAAVLVEVDRKSVV